MAYKCVVFDFDGTLADTEEKAFNIYNELATKYKYSTVTMEELQHIKNLHVKEIKEIVDIPFYQFPRALRDGQKMMRKESNEIHAFAPDIHAFFTALRRETKHIGILTSNIKKTVSDFLITYDISHEIEFIMCSALMSKSKKSRRCCVSMILNLVKCYISVTKSEILKPVIRLGSMLLRLTGAIIHPLLLKSVNPRS